MTKEITKSNILQEIADKLKLRELMPDRFTFSEMVIPTYDIGQHLKTYKNTWAEKSVTNIDPKQMFEVPGDEKWKLNRYDVVFMGAGAYTIAGVFTQRHPIVSGEYCYLDLTAAQTVSYHIDLNVPIVLLPLDRLFISIDGYTSTQNVRLYIDYEMETIR